MHAAYSRAGISASQTPGIFVLCMYFFHSGIYSRAVFNALSTNEVMQTAFESAQTQLGDRQHTQFTNNNIPAHSLEADILDAGGRLPPQGCAENILNLQRYMEAVRRGTLFKHW